MFCGSNATLLAVTIRSASIFIAWLLVAAPAICASFSGIVFTDSGTPVSGVTVRWSNQSQCVPTPPHGTPQCYGPTITGSAITASDGSFAASNLPAETYFVCAYPVRENQLSSCDWLGFGETGPARVTLTDNQNLNGLKYVLRSGSRLVMRVEDPRNAVATSVFLPGVVVGTGAYYRADYDTNRLAYTVLMPKGVAGRIFLDTLLLAQDADGNSLPINTPTLPFTTQGDETRFSLGVRPALVNAASYSPGVAEGTIATLFGSGFTDIPGIHAAASLPLPTQLSGTTVTVNGVAAPLLAVVNQNGEQQINFQVPHSPAGFDPLMTIVVDNNGRKQTFHSKKWIDQLGIFSVFAHLSGESVSAASPAQPGERVIIYWTGMNGHNFAFEGGFFIPDGIPAPPSAPCVSYFNPQVTIGGIRADVQSCSAAPALTGIGQLVLTVPPDLGPGNHEVAVTMSTSIKGNVVSLPVRVP
jgi:uncharacterized protein (TIGR03437 family)